VLLTLLAAVVPDQRRDVADQDPDRNRQQDDDDQRRLEAGEENLEADLLRVLQGDDQDQGAEAADQPGSPVDRLLLLRYRPILVGPIRQT